MSGTHQMSVDDQHVLLKMSDEPDCNFVATWLIKAAEAQHFWTEILDRPCSARHVQLLYADGIPDLAAAALELLGELEHHLHVVSLNLYPDENGLFCRELALLVELGFFVREGQCYQIAIPEKVELETVLAAALEVSSVVGDLGGIDVLQPELQLTILSGEEAECLRSTLFATRRFGFASTIRATVVTPCRLQFQPVSRAASCWFVTTAHGKETRRAPRPERPRRVVSEKIFK